MLAKLMNTKTLQLLTPSPWSFWYPSNMWQLLLVGHLLSFMCNFTAKSDFKLTDWCHEGTGRTRRRLKSQKTEFYLHTPGALYTDEGGQGSQGCREESGKVSSLAPLHTNRRMHLERLLCPNFQTEHEESVYRDQELTRKTFTKRAQNWLRLK